VACKDFTKNLLEQTSDKVNVDLEIAIPRLICDDANFLENQNLLPCAKLLLIFYNLFLTKN
jgi:hypothetical protein